MEFLEFPFMQRALMAGIAIGLVLPFLGVFATLRRMSFFGDGLAHASLLGVAIGVVAGVNPFGVALVVGGLLGAGIYMLERRTNIASDAVIGVVFTTGLALGIVLMSMQRGFQPDLITFLFGNILAIGRTDLWIISILSLAIFTALIVFRKQLTMLAFDRETAWVSGIRTGALDFFFYVILALTIVLGVKLLGIILVSALLIIPPTTAKLFARSFRELIVGSIILGQTAILAGLIISYYLDLPSGAAIILTGSSILFSVLLGTELLRLLGVRVKG